MSRSTISTVKHTSSSKRLRGLKRDIPLLIMLCPGIVFMLVFNYLPMAGVLLAFKNFKVAGRNLLDNFIQSKWVGFNNFKFLFITNDAYTITRNTVLYNFSFIIINLVFGILLAIIIHELHNRRLAKLYQTIYFLPYFLSWVVVSYLVFSLLSHGYGVFNVLLERIGKEPVTWYTETKYWPFIIVIVNAWKYTGYSSIIYLATITGFDIEYYEAAAIDGANKLQQIRHITIPLLVPMMTILTILALGRLFHADFGLFYNVPLESGQLLSVTNVIDTYVFRSLRGGFLIGMSAAAGLYQSTVGFILIVFSNLIVRKINSENSLF